MKLQNSLLPFSLPIPIVGLFLRIAKMAEQLTKFTRPPPKTLETPNLYVANCGPALGISHFDIATAFSRFGEVVGVHAADDSGVRVIICYADACSATRAMEMWGGGQCSCPDLGNRVLHVRYSALQQPRKVADPSSVCLEASELGIPGIYLIHDFVSRGEEQELLAEVDARPWNSLAKRRVQHYGYEFLYETRNVNSKQFLGELPHFLSSILKRLPLFPNANVAGISVNQLTVNEYPAGVGLSPHVDTHSAFEENIFSLSLASSCIMDFRKYSKDLALAKSSTHNGESFEQCSNFERKALFLPPRSMLLMSGEGRYAWHHYIPHHKVDIVGGQVMRRGQRRVSFTFRKVRKEPCCCGYAQFCDSQSKMLI